MASKITSRSVPPDSFKHAELVFEGIDHSNISFEALIYFNNPDADHKTGRTAETGYVGSFSIFGHEKSLSALEHSSITERPLRYSDLRESDPLTPIRQRVVVTNGLRMVLSEGKKKLDSITLVPVARAMGKKRRRLVDELLKYARVSLKTY